MKIVIWFNNLLSGVAWWVKGIIMIISSIICTMLPSPIPLADISFIATLQSFNSIYWYLVVVGVITIVDTGFAVITYQLGGKLTSRFMRKEKSKEKLEKIKSKLHNSKLADIWVFLASATPIPFTLTIYAASAVEYKIEKFLPLILFGRLLKYSIVAVAFYFGYNLLNV